MKTLIVSATDFELARIRAYCDKEDIGEIDFCVSGVGTVATSFSLTRTLSTSNIYNLLINVGICGSFTRELELGQVVEVGTEIFTDLGIEGDKGFVPLSGSKLLDRNAHPYKEGLLINTHPQFGDLTNVLGSTSDVCHTNYSSIDRIVNIFNPDTESMEGAAFFYVAKHFDTPFAQVRAVSNYVGERDKSKWKIDEAVEAVSAYVIDYLASIYTAGSLS
ncbi:MAG: futalosine hydrolase [Bacteroidales bacterium]